MLSPLNIWLDGWFQFQQPGQQYYCHDKSTKGKKRKNRTYSREMKNKNSPQTIPVIVS